jgi:hypothetical protein
MLLEVCGTGRWGLERRALVAEAFTRQKIFRRDSPRETVLAPEAQ